MAAFPHDVSVLFCRVLRPGGLVVLTDSEQVGDRRGREAQLGYFSNVNEPYFE